MSANSRAPRTLGLKAGSAAADRRLYALSATNTKPSASTDGFGINNWEYVDIKIKVTGIAGDAATWLLYFYDEESELWFPDTGGATTSTIPGGGTSVTGSRTVQVKGRAKVAVHCTALSAGATLDVWGSASE